MDQIEQQTAPSWRGLRLWQRPLPSRACGRRRQRMGAALRLAPAPGVTARLPDGTGRGAPAF